MTIVVALFAAAVAAGASRFASRRLIPTAPLHRTNYRGLLVPTGLGIAVFAGIVVACGFLALVSEISTDLVAQSGWLLPLAAAGGFGLLGLYDDAASAIAPSGDQGIRSIRGIKGHAEALVRGRLTSGGLKMLVGSTLGFAFAAPATDGFAFAVVGGAIIALSAHVLNAFDLRPGRAGKIYVVGAIPLAVAGGPLRAAICASIGAVLAMLPDDLRERSMLGDAGAGALGAFAGSSAVLLSTRTTMLITLAILALLTVVAEGPTLSRVIAKLPVLRAFDRWGRVAEEPVAPPAAGVPETTEPGLA